MHRVLRSEGLRRRTVPNIDAEQAVQVSIVVNSLYFYIGLVVQLKI